MKILFLTRLFYPHVGGVEKHVEKVSEELIKQGHSVTILTTKFHEKLKDKETKDGIKIIRFKQPGIKFFGILESWFWMVKNINLFIDSDVVHIHDVFVWYWPLRILLPFKKVFVTFHGQWGKFPLSINDVWQKKVGAILSTGNLSIGEYIPKNYGFKADMVSYGAAGTVVYISKKDTKKVLYVGRLDPEMPVRKIMNVLAKIKNQGFKVDICGDGRLVDEAQDAGEVHGFTDPTFFYKKAKYVFVSGYLTIIEALNNGCLVFATYNNQLQKDYYELTPFREFMVLERNEKKLYEKFLYYTKHPKQADELIKSGRRWAREQTWDKMSDSYQKIWLS